MLRRVLIVFAGMAVAVALPVTRSRAVRDGLGGRVRCAGGRRG